MLSNCFHQLLFTLLFSLTVNFGVTIPTCSEIVAIESPGLLHYLANVSFSAPKSHEGEWTLNMETDVPFTFLGGFGVWVTSDPDEGKATFQSRDNKVDVKRGELINFRFRISWFTDRKAPTVTKLNWQGIDVCKT